MFGDPFQNRIVNGTQLPYTRACLNESTADVVTETVNDRDSYHKDNHRTHELVVLEQRHILLDFKAHAASPYQPKDGRIADVVLEIHNGLRDE